MLLKIPLGPIASKKYEKERKRHESKRYFKFARNNFAFSNEFSSDLAKLTTFIHSASDFNLSFKF